MFMVLKSTKLTFDRLSLIVLFFFLFFFLFNKFLSTLYIPNFHIENITSI